jgi:putative transposase
MVLDLIEEAQDAGARIRACCEVLGLDTRTVQRWRAQDVGDDRRDGPKTTPSNKLSETERKAVLEVANSREFRDKSPSQIVPTLADKGRYIASESTFYRTLHAEDQQNHRGRSKPPTATRPSEHRAMGPNQVWSWDITYLRAPVVGMFFYLYLFVDVWSRKIVAHAVHECEDSELASELFESVVSEQRLEGVELVLHQDNGSPMKGATLKATIERLGVIPSYSRPHVSDDNPYSESLLASSRPTVDRM